MDVPGSDRRVDVVMATYNGSRYLPEMLRSLVAQQWPGLRLMVSDDASTDETVDLLKNFDALPVEIACNQVNIGARDNFSRALGLADAPYVALADQDDVWMPDKIARLMAKMAQLEMEVGDNVPLLVFSELIVVDSDLNVLLSSFYEGTFKSSAAATLADFAISNHVPGCAIMVNRALLDYALPVPAEAYMHDWWLCLAAAATGRVGHVDAPLVKFRRHGSNHTESGHQKRRSTWILQALGRAMRPKYYIQQRREDTASLARRANALMAVVDRRLGDRLVPEAHDMYAALSSRSWRRRYKILRQAHSGESPVTDLLVALQMGAAANRSDVMIAEGHYDQGLPAC